MENLTVDLIKDKLQNDKRWLERGILAIYEKQTSHEKYVQSTVEHNGVGFSGCDGRYLSYTARWIQSGKHLSGQHVTKAQKKMMKYSGQLLKIAKEKQSA